jgi:hypothetical protein
MVIFRIWPLPGGPPKPLTETYRLPPGPNVIAVGKFSPLAITVRWPFLILMIWRYEDYLKQGDIR